MRVTASDSASAFSEKSIEFLKRAGVVIFNEDCMHPRCACSDDVARGIIKEHRILRGNPKLLKCHLINSEVGFTNTNRR